jgi:hypothetical protein
MINLQTPSRYWGKQKTKLKTMFPNLEDSDFEYAYGDKEAMLTRLQFKIGKTRSELNELITDLGKKQKYQKHWTS